ncbi:hypothetical protein AAFF_G00425210 [Aldrovandia affinis]|uniref:Uncharacterized protein n=1 Tax=Aldrovandia affinis TaxID=143900 RepID=A0AAD7WZJ9_9TELE|nr:hypothetical protein AAFF_G00425210 [Aldrovandia affinis]
MDEFINTHFRCLFSQPANASQQDKHDVVVLGYKELSKKVKEDKNKEEKKVHPAGESTAAQRNTPSKSKGRGKKESEAEGHAENLPNQLEPLTVEFSVHLQKWQTASQADRT